jgi:hypothetical protein
MNNREPDIMKLLMKKFNSIYVGLLVLTGLRIINLDIWTMIGDGMTALMIYFFLRQPNKCMSLMVLINGLISDIYGILRLNYAWKIYSNDGSFMTFALFFIAVYAILLYSIMTYYGYYGYRNLNDNTGILPQTDNETNYQSLQHPPVSNYKPFSGKGTILG